MSSHSDTVTIYLICMACEERGKEKMGKGREGEKKKREERVEEDKGGKKCLQKRLQHAASWLTVNFFLEVSIVQRTFEMAHLTALCSTPSRCHHLHTSYQMKMDGENQRHWDERFIKVTLSSKLLKPLYLITVVGILTYQHNLFYGRGRSAVSLSAGEAMTGWPAGC